MTADECCDCCAADEAIVADILEELCEKVASSIRRKVKFRPRLQRSFSCDYDEEEICCDDVYREYHNSLPITCVIEGCDCECKRLRVTTGSVETVNFNVRRASVVSFEETPVVTPSSEKGEFFYDAEESLDKSRRESLYSLDEHDELDENENSMRKNNFEEEKKKNNFFKSIFTRRQKSIEEENNLKNRRKYSSTTDLPSKTLKRSSSFFKKKLNNLINNDSTSFLKRSFSFRNLSEKKVEKSREKLSEMKSKEWAQSLQSLVENDNSVSYKDLSFINYDALNKCNYDEAQMRKKNNHGRIWRTQSMLVNGSLEARSSPKLIRGTSISGVSYHHPSTRLELNNTLDNNIIDQTGAVSLPSLHHLNQENGDVSPESSPAHRYRRRPQSISSEDGARPARPRSFRSAGGGCAKLRRHNACRQKSRTLGSLPTKSLQFLRDDAEGDEDNRNAAVRSRSLNHLDTLDMRQGVPSSSDAALKDARSEPDCTRPLLAPPSATAPSLETASPGRPETPQRRHVLSRSQKSSSECFSVNFEVGDESTFDTELFFPATRGVTLHESLSKQCELRNIDLSSCDAWLSDREGNTQSWLSQSQDTACLVGRHVRITHKDSARSRPGSSQASHSRKLSGNFRPKTGSFFSSSTEEQPPATPWTPQDTKSGEFDYKKQTKQRWSGLFGNNKDTKQSMEQLIEQLNNYSKFGVPSCQVYPMGQSESTDAIYKLEDDWRDIINVSELTEKQQKQQTALWELIKTEVAYIKTLKVVTDLFLACLLNLQSSNILKEIDTAKLFSNISDILEANVQFWRNSLFPLVRDMRTYRQPPCIETMCEGFLKMKDGFQAYYRFCGEQARCQHYCRENLAHNDLFTAYLAWCETQKDCNRLRLMDILVQPMQRLTKYGLLLKAILKNTDDEVERDNLSLMIRSVDDFVNNVNSSLKQKQDNERLKGIIARIESYDIVETKDDDLERLLKSHNQLDLNKPMLNCPPERKRHLLLEGDLKLKDGSTSKTEVHCFLLTDMLLVCKASTKKGGATMRVVRQPYLVDRLVITEINKETPTLACIYKNEFDMAVAAFLLQNNDAKKLKSWKDGIAKAQKLYAQAKSYLSDENVDPEFSFEYSLENDFHCLQLAPRSPLATSSRASRVSSLAHSHSGSVEMNDQSSLGSAKEPSRAVSIENDNRTASISSDEGVSSTDQCENFSRGQHRQAMMKRIYRSDNKRYHTAGVVDDIKKNDSRDASIHKRLSWNCGAIQDDKKQQDQT